MANPPFSSEYDPTEEAEGSIDPLGLQPIYERLADRLLPGVTVRMGRPRFLTAMAIGARVCDGWGAEAVAADSVTPPWLVYEWFVIEAFVRARESLAEQGGIPGIQKVERALRAQRPVNANAYLKTATVFGFSGIFRRLARHIGILTDEGRLDDGGFELVAAWERDQGLAGFLDGTSGPGHDLLVRLRRAVSQGMEKAATTHQSGDFWREAATRLDPARPGKRESQVLLGRIRARSGRPDMVGSLADALLAARGPIEWPEEAKFLRRLGHSTFPELRELLAAIDAYEAFCRAITDAFDGLRHLSRQAQGALVGAGEFAKTKAAAASLAALPAALKRIRAHERLLDWEKGLETALIRFEAVRTAEELFEAILAHHTRVQDEKPPEGKRTWVERGRQDKVLVRPAYLLDELPAGVGAGGYTHEYRLPTFSRFLSDLGAYA